MYASVLVVVFSTIDVLPKYKIDLELDSIILQGIKYMNMRLGEISF